MKMNENYAKSKEEQQIKKKKKCERKTHEENFDLK